jgi:hypothetical protein
MPKLNPNFIDLTNICDKLMEKKNSLLRQGENYSKIIFTEEKATIDLRVAHLWNILQNLQMLEHIQNQYLCFKSDIEYIAEQYKNEYGIDLEDIDIYKKPFFKHISFRTEKLFENDKKEYDDLKKMTNSYRKKVTLLYFNIEFLVKNIDLDFDKELKEDLDNFLKEFKFDKESKKDLDNFLKEFKSQI